jgi:putative drug exporter of the RND superfamily
VVVALGVLLDTFVVRSLLVPALALESGPRIWAPSRLDSVGDQTTADGSSPTISYSPVDAVPEELWG